MRNDSLDKAFKRLHKLLPAKPGQALGWLLNPDARHLRTPLGVFLVILSFFWFLPVIGIEYLPIGMMLIAYDIPALRKPVGKAVAPLLDGAEWLVRKWKAGRPFWPIHLAHRR